MRQLQQNAAFNDGYRAWYLDDDWLVLRPGVTHAVWAKHLLNDPDLDDQVAEAKLMRLGGIKQFGASFVVSDLTDPMLRIIQERVQDMVRAHLSGYTERFKIWWGQRGFLQTKAEELLLANHAQDLIRVYQDSMTPNRKVAMNGFTRKLHGGRSEGHSPSEFVPQALVRGTIHEMEHTDDCETAMEIAMDHLIEHPDYYDVIEAMEAQMSPRMMTPNVATAVASEAAVLAREAPAMAQAVRAAAPEIAAAARVVVPRSATWIGRSVQWFREGKTTARVIAMLRESGIPKRAAVAIEEAAKAFIAAELQTAATKVASRAVKRIPRTERMRTNAGNYVWVIDNDFEPIEGPYGPHSLVSAKTFARISATKGKSARAVSRGVDPTANSFSIIRIYQAGTGQRLL